MVEDSTAKAILSPDDDPKSELNVLRREVRQLQATVRDSALQIASQQDEIVELRNAIATAEMEVEEGLVREGNLRMQLESQGVKRQQVESTMAAAEALVSSLREMMTTETENGLADPALHPEPEPQPQPQPSYTRNPFTLRKETGSLEDISAFKLDQVLNAISEHNDKQEVAQREETTGKLQQIVSAAPATTVAVNDCEQNNSHEEASEMPVTTVPDVKDSNVTSKKPAGSYRRPTSLGLSPLRSYSHPPLSPQPSSPKRRSLPSSPSMSPQLAALSAEASSLLKSAFEPTPTSGGHQKATIRSSSIMSDSPLPTVVEKIAKSSGAFGVTIRRPSLPSGMGSVVTDAHSGEIYALTSSQDGQWTVSGGDDRSIKIFDRDGKPYSTITESARSVTALGIHQDTSLQGSGSVVIYSGGSDGTVRAFARSSRRRAKWNLGAVLSVHSQPVRRILVTEKAGLNGSSNLILTCSTDRTIRMSDVEHGRRPFSVTSPSAVFDVASFDENGSGLIVSGHKDGGIRLWSSRDGNAMVGGTKIHNKGVVSVSCLDDGFGIVSLGRDNALRLTDVRMNIGVVKDMEGGVQTVSDWHRAAANGRHVVCGSGRPGNLSVWNVDTGKVVRKLPSQTSDVDADVLDMVARKLRNPGCILLPLWTSTGQFVCAHRMRQVAFWVCS